MILPKIPSQLLEIALKDIRDAIEKGIKVDMSSWVEYSTGKPCAVCLGGAVMIGTCKENFEMFDFTVDLPLDWDEENRYQYCFLDNIRNGNVKGGLGNLDLLEGLDLSQKVEITNIELYYVSFEDNKQAFFEWIEKLITYFKSIDL